MPIAGTQPALEIQIKNALTLDVASNPDLFASTITNAIASVVPSGLIQQGNTMVPLVPAGAPGTQIQSKNSASLDVAATPDTASEALAAAIVTLVPLVPPVAQKVLQLGIKNAFSQDTAATPDTVAAALASAIISYYTSAGVV
jgi:hypothetical protein